jgi:double-stranded uracil-DNA glycosylase
VLRSCTRTGSLDSAIDGRSEIANDFRAFLRIHPDISHVYFNGAKAADTFRRRVLPGLDVRGLRYIRLPSTSPANASIAFERKRAAWQAILKPAQRKRK